MNFKFNFGLNSNTVSILSLKLQNFIWFTSYQRKIIRPFRIGLSNVRNMALYSVGHGEDNKNKSIVTQNLQG